MILREGRAGADGFPGEDSVCTPVFELAGGRGLGRKPANHPLDSPWGILTPVIQGPGLFEPPVVDPEGKAHEKPADVGEPGH